mmetsp:Transcript_4528/g.8722  ORF Transcript_4528/g.8722 Transcript_4528/m.8722 type:complete len:145 (+) Transcript_4528:1908-2342(+)
MSQVSSNRDYSLSDVEFEILTKLDSTHRSTKSDDLNNVSSVSANVEIVTDDEPIFQDDNGKGMNSAAVDESSTATSNTPVILKFFLRIIDVSLFVMEKSVTNGLPGMFRIYNVMKQRIDASSREGMGKRGWEPLDNLGDASRRY